MPSASLGSNQVDFGGMMPPASATAIRSSMLRRVEREGHRHLAGVDAALELGEAAPAADEVDALVGARVGDAEERLDQVAGEQRDRQPADRVRRCGTRSDRSLSRYQRPPRNMPNSDAAAGRTGDADGRDGEAFARSRPAAAPGVRPLRSRMTRL